MTNRVAGPCVPLLLLLWAVSSACDTSPTSPTSPSRVPPASDPIRLQGRVVNDTGGVVPGAKISFYWGSFLADASGRFAVEVGASSRGDGVTVTHEGFEPSTLYIWWPEAGPGDTVERDLRLYPIRRVTAGQSFEITILPGDPYCTTLNMDEGLCQRVRLVAPTAGFLTVRADWPFWVVLNGGDAEALPVDAGAETLVEVLLVEPPPRTTVVTTTLDPR